MIILGAGMAGCLAGALNPKANILEAANEIPNHHKAVLRFRDDKISCALGIDFKPVTVRKAIWYESSEVPPAPRWSNLYSQKVTGKILDRSINNLDAVTRYIAPSDFHLMLGEMCHGRIEFNSIVSEITPLVIKTKDQQVTMRSDQKIISTMPMPILLKAIGIDFDQDFSHAPINVTRFEIEDCDVHQTIYYPDHDLSVYRATLTGNQLIIESVGDIEDNDIYAVGMSLGLRAKDFCDIEGKKTEQQYGKIAPISDAWRKNAIYKLSSDFNIYSLGRFAIWKNILLDDVYDDIYKVRRLMNKGLYDAQLEEIK